MNTKKFDIFIDIENTLIETLDCRRPLIQNIENIKKFLKTIDVRHVSLFTWGWITYDEIDGKLVDKLFNLLEIEYNKRGDVFVKSDSVEEAIKAGWLHESDKARALYPGMMSEFGISKVSCFIQMQADKNDVNSILIDDLVEENDDNVVQYMTHCICLYNPIKLYYKISKQNIQ